MLSLKFTVYIYIFFISYFFVSANRVLELDDEFVNVYSNDPNIKWLVMFYTPWCHPCKQFEPDYMQVAQRLHNEDIGVNVARVDCSKYTLTASHFNVKTFPTIKFISTEKIIDFVSDRDREELIDFSKRLTGPYIRKISDCNQLKSLHNNHEIYFVYFGNNLLGTNISQAAKNFHVTNWFYHCNTRCSNFTYNSLYALKPTSSYHQVVLRFANTSYDSLNEWILANRFPHFVKITNDNLHLLLNTGKLLAIGIVKETRSIKKLTSEKHDKLRDLVRKIAKSYEKNEKFIFGWTSYSELINSIAMKIIQPLPNFIIINASNLEYFLIEGDPTIENIMNLLDDLSSEDSISKPMGGNAYHHRIMRTALNGYRSLNNMYKGNPVLTLLIFGLPFSFFIIILYTSCCSDILDAKDDDENAFMNGHAKRE